MTTVGADSASDQVRFAAREFVARWSRDTGETLTPVMSDRVLFAYEMGYLRGRSDGALESTKMFEEINRAREEVRKDSNDDTK